MTVKSTVVKKEAGPKSEFPVLMEFFGDSFVVLFTAKTTGMVVSADGAAYKVGDYSEKWVAYSDKSTWKPFNGKVVLENI